MSETSITDMPAQEVIDTVKSFAEYSKIGETLVYQYARGEGFPRIQPRKNCKIRIFRNAALEWLKSYRT